MGWDDVKKGNGNQGEFTKVEEGKPVLVHLLGDDPKKHVEHWKANKSLKCLGEKDCPECKAGTKARLQYSIPVFNLTTNRQEILKKGRTIFMVFLETKDAYDGNLGNVDFKISVKGSNLSAEYTVIPVVPSKFKPEMVTVSGEEKDHDPFAESI